MDKVIPRKPHAIGAFPESADFRFEVREGHQTPFASAQRAAAIVPPQTISTGDSMVTPQRPDRRGWRCSPATSMAKGKYGGAEGARTPDLVTASHRVTVTDRGS